MLAGSSAEAGLGGGRLFLWRLEDNWMYYTMAPDFKDASPKKETPVEAAWSVQL